MKKFFITTTIIISQYGFAQTKKIIADSAKFSKYVAAHISSFSFDGQKPTGDGWAILEKQFADNQFVAWGEYHNSALFSKLSNYALVTAAGYGFNNWCVEVSPFVAAELTGIAQLPKPFDTITAISKEHPAYGTFPFFKTREDVQMVVTASKHKYHIWGIDQEFQMAFPYCINRAYRAQSPAVRKKYKAVYDSLLARWWMPDEKLLDSLEKVTVQKKLQMALADIKVSRTIYYESDNLLRATLMKKNFYRYYDNEKSNSKKVFFKMGANHLAKGLNLTTHVYDIGNAVYELSEHHQTGFGNVYFINRYYMEDGKIADDLANEASEYPKEFLKLYDKDKWIVLDVRPLRFRMRNDKTLTEDTYEAIYKYDYIVVSPEIKE